MKGVRCRAPPQPQVERQKRERILPEVWKCNSLRMGKGGRVGVEVNLSLGASVETTEAVHGGEVKSG